MARANSAEQGQVTGAGQSLDRFRHVGVLRAARRGTQRSMSRTRCPKPRRPLGRFIPCMLARSVRQCSFDLLAQGAEPMPKPQDIPACPPVPDDRSSGRVTRKYQIHLITPLFGGGVEAGKPDPTLPIRGTSIRGQLQFWWRATRGATCSTRQDLFTRHATVWGTTERASPVEVEIPDFRADKPAPCLEYQPRRDGTLQPRWKQPFDRTALTYALFPFQGQLSKDRRQVEEAPAEFIENASFNLRVRFPEALRQDVETAVWAWVNFGGLGARTRRGCGALFCQELAPRDFSDLPRWFGSVVEFTQEAGREWPTLPSRLLSHRDSAHPIAIWDRLIGFWRYFRQGEGFARNSGRQPNRPGRSRYPEPETIRRVTKPPSRLHPRLAHIPDDAFPRAELGLPIVFHYQGQGEPPDTALYPANGPEGQRRDRLASPLILKPLALANGQAVPLVLRLVTPRLTGVDLRRGDASLTLPPTTVVQDGRLATYRDSPLGGAASGSALDAFFALARRPDNDFQEVTR
jgi:CRISPR-associated protein Cmr1